MKILSESALKALDQRSVLNVVVTTASKTKVTRRKNLFRQTDIAICNVDGNTNKLYGVSVMIEFAENEWLDVMPFLQQIALEKASAAQPSETTPKKAK